MRQIRIPLLTGAARGRYEGRLRFVGDWQDIPPSLAHARLVVELGARRGVDTGLAIRLQTPGGAAETINWFGPMDLNAPGLYCHLLAGVSLPTRTRACVEVASGVGCAFSAAAYIEGTVP